MAFSSSRDWLGRARVLLLALPLFALVSSVQIACGGKILTSGVTTSDVYGQGGGPGYGGWTDYDGSYGSDDGYTYGGYGYGGYYGGYGYGGYYGGYGYGGGYGGYGGYGYGSGYGGYP